MTVIMLFVIGCVFAFGVAYTVYIFTGRAETRPLIQGFYGGAVTGTSALPCGRLSSEAEELYTFFATRCTDQHSDNLRDMRNLLSKLTCLKKDLMSPMKTITSIKELGFATHMDIQPVADVTARCFARTIPERDLELVFIKWKDYGMDLIRRLTMELSIDDKTRADCERLFLITWKDVYEVSRDRCIGKPPAELYGRSVHDPFPAQPDELIDKKEYDGYY